jgi:hypothetical protein
MRRTLALVSLAAFAACGGDSKSTAPNVFNINPGTPPGWGLVGVNAVSYTIGIDHSTTHGGSGALHIASIDSNPALFRGVGQYILANQYRGKRIRYSGWVRHVNLSSTTAGLWMRIDGNFETLGFDNYSVRPLKGTADWHQIEIILDVPESAVGIQFGVLMSARGELLADDLKIEVIAPNGPTTNTLADPQPTTFDAPTFYAQNVGPRAAANLDFESK